MALKSHLWGDDGDRETTAIQRAGSPRAFCLHTQPKGFSSASTPILQMVNWGTEIFSDPVLLRGKLPHLHGFQELCSASMDAAPST